MSYFKAKMNLDLERSRQTRVPIWGITSTKTLKSIKFDFDWGLGEPAFPRLPSWI